MPDDCVVSDLVGDDLYDPSGNTIVMRLGCAKLNSKLYELNSSLMYKYAEVKSNNQH